MTAEAAPQVIPGAGVCMTSRNVLERTAPVRWMSREVPQGPGDSGWRILSMADTPEYMRVPGNLLFVDFNVVLMVAPVLAGIFEFPVGSELMLDESTGAPRVFDSRTNTQVPPELLTASSSDGPVRRIILD